MTLAGESLLGCVKRGLTLSGWRTYAGKQLLSGPVFSQEWHIEIVLNRRRISKYREA